MEREDYQFFYVYLSCPDCHGVGVVALVADTDRGAYYAGEQPCTCAHGANVAMALAEHGMPLAA